jgi:DNA-binding transcriptional MerR regulator
MAVAAKKKIKKTGSADIVIPDRLYFRIGDVAKLCGLEPYVLRFWETEFPQLAPKKSGTGQRLYRRKDVENVVRIKQLLYDEGFTIPGARHQLKLDAKPMRAQTALPFSSNGHRRQELRRVRDGLRELLKLLSARH